MSDMASPRVFISYSHDSEEHRALVRKIADTLRSKYNVDVCGDFYSEDLPIGMLLTDFMQTIRDMDYVICILTPQYKSKADGGKGGVGYEKNILSEAIYNQNKTKFIPVVIGEEKVSFKACTPHFLLSTMNSLRLGQDDHDHSILIEEIARAVHLMPKNPKPPLGENLLLQTDSINKSEKDDVQVLFSPEKSRELFNQALFYAKNDEERELGILVRQAKKESFKKLNEFKNMLLKERIQIDEKNRYEIMDKCVQTMLPLFLVVFGAQASLKSKYNEQQEEILIEDLLELNWLNTTGLPWIDHIPEFLAFVYHQICGAFDLQEGKFDETGRVFKKILRFRTESSNVYYSGNEYSLKGFTGWIVSLGGKCFESFNYLYKAHQRWDWLKFLFEDEEEFQKSLVIYQITMNIFDYFEAVRAKRLSEENDFFEVSKMNFPPTFLSLDRKLFEKAQKSIVGKSNFFATILGTWSVNKKEAIEQWPIWLRHLAHFQEGGRFFYYMIRDDLMLRFFSEEEQLV